MEAFITSAQDQAIRTKAYNANVLNCTDDSLCRICHSSDETIYHLLSTCPVLAAKAYLQHNSVASLIHKHICKFYGMPTCEKPWLYTPQPLVLSNNVQIMWDFGIRTDRIISAHQPDIVILNVLQYY